MSYYCKACRFDVKQKPRPDACPFNYLYWNFLDRHRGVRGDNPRLAQPYRIWDRMNDERRDRTRRDAERFLDNLDKPGKSNAPAAA